MQERLCKVKKCMAAVRKALSRSRRRAANLHLTALETTIVLAIYVLSRYSISAVAVYVDCKNKVRSQSNHSAAEVREFSESLYLQTSIDDLVGLEHGQCRRHVRVRRAAVSFLAQLRTLDWLESQNVLGAAPSSCAMARTYLTLREDLGDSQRDGALARALHNNPLDHNAGRYLRMVSELSFTLACCVSSARSKAGPAMCGSRPQGQLVRFGNVGRYCCAACFLSLRS